MQKPQVIYHIWLSLILDSRRLNLHMSVILLARSITFCLEHDNLRLWSVFSLGNIFLIIISFFFFLIFYLIIGFGVHEQSMRDSCVGTHMAVCFAFPLPFTHIWLFSPGYPSPPPPLTGPPLFPPIDPSV